MTYVTDPIGDFLTRMRNAQGARRAFCEVPWSRMKQELAELMKSEGLLEAVEVSGEEPKLQLKVSFVPGKKLTLRRISTPGRRVYSKSTELTPVLHGHGLAILTTSHGLMTDVQARKQKVGGEVLCTIS